MRLILSRPGTPIPPSKTTSTTTRHPLSKRWSPKWPHKVTLFYLLKTPKLYSPPSITTPALPKETMLHRIFARPSRIKRKVVAYVYIPFTTDTIRSRGRNTQAVEAHSTVGRIAIGSHDLTATPASNVADPSSSSTPVVESTSSAARTAFSGYPPEVSPSPDPSSSAAKAQTSTISDLKPRVLSRLTGNHRTCCFYGYKWCCYAQGCLKYTQCGHDLRVHFRKAHGGQVASFNFARLIHRTEQEAKAWAEGEEMGDDDG